MTPMPTQTSGADFLTPLRRAFLWDQPRVGKTGAAILAADRIGAVTILVVTTASGRAVWRRAFPAWSPFSRRITVLGVDPPQETDVGIVSWDSLPRLSGRMKRRPDLIILDEDHRASNPNAKRTQLVYGLICDDGEDLQPTGVVRPGDRCWHLSGLPAPHDLSNHWPRMRASCPERLDGVVRFSDFKQRYCVAGHKRLPNGERIEVVFGGRNADELRERLDGMFLRRTQADVGIRPPRYEIMPLIVSNKMLIREADGGVDKARVLLAAENGDTKDLDITLGTIKRITGAIKARAAVDAINEEMGNGLEKIVLAYWHREVGDILDSGLRKRGVLRIDGQTPARERERAEVRFRQKNYGVFLAQIKAAGEAIDLSPAREMWMVETSSTPGDMEQISKRIVNVAAPGQRLVRVVTLEGSIDEALQARLLALWAPIRQVLQ